MTTEESKAQDLFPTATAGLPQAGTTSLVPLQYGDHFKLHIRPVRKRIDDNVVRMLAYNDSIPGPTLHVDQGSEISVEVRNDGDEITTVHWHGLRLENRFDGVPHDTQAPIPVGGVFTYKVQFPDPGIYWYHPHVREDFAQELGLYGAIVVRPTDDSFWPSVDREIVVTLDDLLIEDGRIAPFSRSGPNYAAMGRFGNVLLINGETQFSARAAAGEIVRLYLVNTANTRIFNFAMPGARMKLVGGDSGRYEREMFVEEVMIAPSERVVVDVLLEATGDVQLQHRTPEKTYPLGKFSVEKGIPGSIAASFDALRVDEELVRERQSIKHDVKRPPDKVLSFVASMPLLYGNADEQASSYSCPMHPEVVASEPSSCPKCGMRLAPAQPTVTVAASYICPMHPDVVASEPSSCPKCGMRLVPAQPTATVAASYLCPMHPDVVASEPSSCPKCGMKLIAGQESETAVAARNAEAHHPGGDGDHESGDGLEWEDLMPEINRASDPSNMSWKIIDRKTGHENGAIAWNFKVGDRVKIRLINEMESDHPMHHPFHIHGAGRFLVLSRNGDVEPNLVWKDTVLVRMGETVDVLLDVTNPGRWMAHCHIAEHIESGMMFSFDVARQ